MDLKDPRWMYLKAVLFLMIGSACLALVVLANPTALTVVCSLLMIWAFARAYYFAFYVIEKYIDPQSFPSKTNAGMRGDFEVWGCFRIL